MKRRKIQPSAKPIVRVSGTFVLPFAAVAAAMRQAEEEKKDAYARDHGGWREPRRKKSEA